MQRKVSQRTVRKIMDRAMAINKACPDPCRDFRIMTSVRRKGALLLRWTTINLDDIDNPVQCYRYECFNTDGTPQNCSVHYADQEEANAFFQGLKTLYKQPFATDHRHKSKNQNKRPK